MSVDGDLHAGLMALVEAMPNYADYDFVWSGKGGDEPTSEYVRVSHLPNDNRRLGLKHSALKKRQGFLILVLCSVLGEYEAVYREKAGSIADQIPEGSKVTLPTGAIEIVNYTIKPGRRENQHWETPIWIEYRGCA